MKLHKLVNMIRELIAAKFFGTITVKFESGKIVQIKKEESIKV